MSKRSRKHEDDLLLSMLTSRDEQEAVSGRFLATGVSNTIMAFIRAEEETGRSGSTAMLASTAMLGLLLGMITGHRTEAFDEVGIVRVAKAAGRIFAQEFEAGIRTEARRRR